ncbi:hypothetical protein IWX90DRAFT_428227 [Phyllosticta citrichinensis]|uniref:Uncharacterized protein n=1 Tax=Phyllosticta citrichinensis TaxID=1130410 RepID=A0ABR1Y003_9PEZI
MDNDKTPMTPRQQSLNMRPLPNFLLTPASDDEGSINRNMRPTRLTTGQSTTIDFLSTPTSKTTPPPSSSPSFLAGDTEAFVQACTSHLFTVTREISVLWPRLYSAFSSYTTPATTATYSNSNNNGNTTNLMHKCQRLHFEAVELLKAVLRAELAGSLDASASEEVLFATIPAGHAPSCNADDAPGSVPGDMPADGTAGSERLRLGRRVLWLLSRWNEVKWLFGVDVDEAPRAVGKVDTAEDGAAAGAGARSGGGRGLDHEDERHDSGAEVP